MFLKVDVSNIDEIREAINTIITKWKRIDILVNNAGIREETPIEDITGNGMGSHNRCEFKRDFFLFTSGY